MSARDLFQKRMDRLGRLSARCERLVNIECKNIEAMYDATVAELQQEFAKTKAQLEGEEVRLREQINQAGRDFAQKKYQLERDYSRNKEEIHKSAENLQNVHKKYDVDLNHLKEEKVNLQISYERQMSALRDLYEEKRRHATVQAAKLRQEWKITDDKFKETKNRLESELAAIQSEGAKKIEAVKDQARAKQDGWTQALDIVRRELDTMTQEKAELEKKLATIREEREKELESARIAMAFAKEQLEIDKATLVEKAEDDQRRAEVEINELKTKIEAAEKELQNVIVSKEDQKKQAEEAYIKEEAMLKDAVKNESEKRDFEHKLYEQEKLQKEKELSRLRDEYEKKKFYWDNQIRTLMMRKSVQDAEHDAEKLRVNREARTLLRSLEAKRDELKQRMNDLKNRHDVMAANGQKENELIHQRWRWRKDRLWSMWQNRLDTLRKEREVIQAQIEQLHANFDKERAKVAELDERDHKRSEELQGFVMQAEEKNKGQHKQHEIQIELEKTRILAQIKECEIQVSDWMDRLKMTQEEVAKNNSGLIAQLNYLDKWAREEEKETELFLHALQRALTVLDGIWNKISLKDAA